MKAALTIATTAATLWLVCLAAGVTTGAARDLGIAGHTNANPSVAASGAFTVVAWGATPPNGPSDVYVAVSRDGGETFGSAVRASDAESRANLSGEQPPRIALVPRRGGDPAIVVVWTSKAADGTRIVSARSDDGGKTFGRPAVVPGTIAAGNRGWESLARDREGRIVAVWLDHRDAVMSGSAHGSHMSHQPGAHAEAPADGVARAQLSKLFFGPLGDDPSSAAARPIAAGVCYCCKTALTNGSDGAIYAAWRHVYPGNIRDIAFSMSRDGGRTFSDPVRVSHDKWELDGCPENGPAIAVDAASRIHVVWPTLVSDSGHETLALFYAMSRDGRAFSPRVRIPTSGAAYHAQIALTSNGLVIAWDEAGKGGRRVRFAHGTPLTDGGVAFSSADVPADPAGTYPVIAATSSGVVAAWTTRDGSDSRIAIAKLR
jgi:hypothetical protein